MVNTIEQNITALPNPALVDALRDLIACMDDTEALLVEQADFAGRVSRQNERIRLTGKADGVALARRLVRDELDKVLSVVAS